MSQQPSRTAKQTGQSDYMEIRSLIEQINNGETSSGYNPLPCEQHLWLMDEENPPLQRLWGFMIGHTVAMGHRTAYASSKRIYDEDKRAWVPGHALTIKHVAKTLGGDVANWHRTWRNAVRRGWARNGTEQEGSERLYLTGKVPKKAKRETLGAHNDGEWPEHIWKYFAEWPADKQADFRKRMKDKDRIAKFLAATLVQAGREAQTEEEDCILQEFGVPPNRQEHAKTCAECGVKGSHKPDCPEAKAMEERRKLLATLRPTLQNSVQTIREYVQLLKDDTVQSENAPVSLLHFQSSTENGSRSVGTLSHSGEKMPQDGDEATRHNQLPARQKGPQKVEPRKPETRTNGNGRRVPALALKPLTKAEREAELRIYEEVERMQQRFKHMEFAREKISPDRKSDQLFAYHVIATVGVEYVEQFLAYVWQMLRKHDKNALGNSPRSLGLIWKEADLYAKRMDETARINKQNAEEWERRQLKACKEILDDPSETAEAKFGARKWLDGWRPTAENPSPAPAEL